MNRTITTSTTHRQCLRQSLRQCLCQSQCQCLCQSLRQCLRQSLRQCLHQSLRQCLRPAALALVALLALVAASCTTDALADPDATNAAGNGNGNPDGIITFAIAPRPGFTEVPVSGDGTASAADAPATRGIPATRSIPATRAEQTDNATRWEQGDILWLDVTFYQDKLDRNTFDATYISALKYDGTEWRYLTEAEVEALNTGNIPSFSRLLRLPRGWEDWPAPGMAINAFHAGSGKPGADGTLTIIPVGELPTTPLITGGTDGIYSLDLKPVPLLLAHYGTSRIRIPADCKVELTNATYCSAITFSPDGIGIAISLITEIPEQSEDTDVFLHLTGTSTAKLTRGDVSCTFTFPFLTDAEGNPIPDLEGNPTREGASYTLTPYTSGTQSPAADYDLTIATEDDLRALAQAVNAGEKLPNGKPFAEARVLQTEDIELTKEWVPIGIGVDNPFRGAYNGNGKTITGLTITTATQPGANNDSYAGLFGCTEGSVLTGIRLREVGINITEGSGGGRLYAGPIAGFISNSTLSLCSADGMVNTNGSLIACGGGIAGWSYYSTISRCRADVEIKAVVTAVKSAYAGGIIGINGYYTFILSCESGDRAVTAEGNGYIYAGGIAGLSDNNASIAFCRTGTNTVTARNADRYNYAGGLVGQNQGYLYSCYSRATAEAPAGTGDKRAGAIVGYNNKQDKVQHCYATGAADKGTSNLDPNQVRNIVYNVNPTEGEIHSLMTGYGGEVKSLDDITGKVWYPFTTHYNPSATPAYGIIPQRAVWTKDAWKAGTDPKYPEINFDYEGGTNE